MATQRLLNCDFFIKGAFDEISSNKAKLLYFYLFINADDFGFVGNANKIIRELNQEEDNDSALVSYTYDNACDELITKGYLFRFFDNHKNQILLVRHFFKHNKYNPKYLTTNYVSLKAQVELVDGCYEMKEKPLKEKIANKTNNANKQIEKEEEKEDDNESSWKEIMDAVSGVTGEEEHDPDALPF